MELQQDSIIVSDRLQALFDFELRSCFTHAVVTEGECMMKYNGEEVRMAKGDCVIIIANHLVTELRPTENFRAKVIFIEPGFMEACTPHTSYGIVGGMTMFINPVMQKSDEHEVVGEKTFRGNKHLGPLIIEAAWIAIKHDAELAATYGRHCHNGLKPQEAIIRVAADLAARIYAILKQNKKYVCR